jgi:hypothetical protein
MHRRHFWPLALALASALLLLAACGGDDDDDDTSGDVTATGEVQESPEGDDDDDATEAPEETDEPEGDDDDGGSFFGGIDACELITAEEAAAVVGGDVDEPQRSEIGEGFNQCLYRIAGGGELAVVVQARADTSPDEYEEQVEENCPEELGGPNPVEGIGDAAHECIGLIVLSGDAMFAITIISDDADADFANQEELARKIVDRLP